MDKKNVIALTLCAAMALSLTACGASAGNGGKAAASSAASSSAVSSAENVRIPSPWQDCETQEDAEALAGFDFVLPLTLEGYGTKTFQVMVDEDAPTAQALFTNESGGEVCIRKGVGTGDISGDYNTYAESKTVTVNGVEVTLKGNGGTVSLATWEREGYAYSVSASDGLTQEAMEDIVSTVAADSTSGTVGGDPRTWGPAEG